VSSNPQTPRRTGQLPRKTWSRAKLSIGDPRHPWKLTKACEYFETNDEVHALPRRKRPTSFSWSIPKANQACRPKLLNDLIRSSTTNFFGTQKIDHFEPTIELRFETIATFVVQPTKVNNLKLPNFSAFFRDQIHKHGVQF